MSCDSASVRAPGRTDPALKATLAALDAEREEVEARFSSASDAWMEAVSRFAGKPLAVLEEEINEGIPAFLPDDSDGFRLVGLHDNLERAYVDALAAIDARKHEALYAGSPWYRRAYDGKVEAAELRAHEAAEGIGLKPGEYRVWLCTGTPGIDHVHCHFTVTRKVDVMNLVQEVALFTRASFASIALGNGR